MSEQEPEELDEEVDAVEPAAPEDDLERGEQLPGLDPWLPVPPEE